MTNRKYFEFTCLGCQGVFNRRSDKANQSNYCRPCRAKKTLTTHNNSRTRLYRIWHGIQQRCNNPNSSCFPKYGGANIKICQEWNTFANFYEWSYQNGYEEHLTIDRVDNSLGYQPSNCRWVSKKQQTQNRTNGLNWNSVQEIRKLYETHTYSDLAQKYNVHKHTIFLVCKNKIWHDASFIPSRHHRWNKSHSRTHHQSFFA